MTFNPQTPQGPDPINQTQPLILQNFQNLGGMITSSGGTVFSQLRLLNVTSAGDLPNPAVPPDPQSVITAQNGTNPLGQFNNHPILKFVNSLGTFPILPDLVNNNNVLGGFDFGFQIGSIKVNFGLTSNYGGNANTISVVFAVPFTNSTTYFAQATQFQGVGPATRFMGISPNAGNNMNVNWDSLQAGVKAYYFAIGT